MHAEERAMLRHFPKDERAFQRYNIRSAVCHSQRIVSVSGRTALDEVESKESNETPRDEWLAAVEKVRLPLSHSATSKHYELGICNDGVGILNP